ncbi:efflux RND transporter periplasmic adaptor subunit [Planctomycetota bacterium]
MKRARKIQIGVAVGVVILLVIGASTRNKKKGGQKPTDVRVAEVMPGKLVELVSAPGEIEPRTSVNISAKVSARVIDLPLEEGVQVTAADPNVGSSTSGSVVVRLDSKDLESRLRSTEAHYKAQMAQIEVQEAQLAAERSNLAALLAKHNLEQEEFNRQKQLFVTKDVSLSDFDTAQLELNQSKASYESAQHRIRAQEMSLVVAKHNLEAQKAQVEEARENIEYTVIRAPMSGTITRINTEVGETVTGTIQNAGTVIMTIADLSEMLLVAQVDEADIGSLEIGQEAIIRVQAYWDREFKGTVEHIALTHDRSQSGAKYFRTEIRIHGDVSDLFCGLTADVDIYTKNHQEVLVIPSQAVLGRKVDDIPLKIREDNPNVDMNKTDALVVFRFVDGKAVITPVTIGASDMTHIIVKSGLEEGDRVIIGPYKELEKLKHEKNVQDEREKLKDKQDEAASPNEVNDPNIEPAETNV